MNDIIATLIIISAFVYYVKSIDTVKKSDLVMVPRDIQKGAQHAADVSQKSQVVFFDGSTHHIHRADRQYTGRGEVAMIFHPKIIPDQQPRDIFVGACLKPNPHIEVIAS